MVRGKECMERKSLESSGTHATFEPLDYRCKACRQSCEFLYCTLEQKLIIHDPQVKYSQLP